MFRKKSEAASVSKIQEDRIQFEYNVVILNGTAYFRVSKQQLSIGPLMDPDDHVKCIA